jgi:FkbM family methyltransferase
MINLLPSAAQLFQQLPRFLRRHRLMTLWMQLTREDPVQLVRIREGSYGYADLEEGMLRLIVIEDEFNDDFFRLGDRLLSNGGVFLDVGANLGLLSLGLASKLGNRVDFHLFEPNPTLRKVFQKSQAFYPEMKVKMNPYAVSDYKSTVKIHFQEGHLGMSHVVDQGGVDISAIRLDDYLAENHIPIVDFMKMDIEGYELAALRGTQLALGKQSIKALYFEYCEKWLARYHIPHDLLSYFESFDYTVCFCCTRDIQAQGGATHTIKFGLSGHGLPLRPVEKGNVPETTDLLAVPRIHLSPL